MQVLFSVTMAVARAWLLLTRTSWAVTFVVSASAESVASSVPDLVTLTLRTSNRFGTSVTVACATALLPIYTMSSSPSQHFAIE